MKIVTNILLLLITSTALASGGGTVYTGKWAGSAFESPVDLNGDGIGGRQFDVDVYHSWKFQAISGLFDTAIVALPGTPENACPNPSSEIELEPSGTAVFKSFQEDAIFAEVDSSVHLCFNPSDPEETAIFQITGGFGSYEGATGTVVTILRDVVLRRDPVTNFPQLVYTTGDFTITLDD
jgi:hypothetical protein